MSVADAKGATFASGDRFSIHTELTRPAYLYVLDIDGQGQRYSALSLAAGQVAYAAGQAEACREGQFAGR